MYKVIQEFRGAHDGFTVITYKVGDDFTHTGSLLKVALDNKWVEEVAEPVEVVEAVEVETEAETEVKTEVETEVETLPEEPAIKTKKHK